MTNPIIIVIEGKTFTLRANDTQSMHDMSAKDRVQLISLLESLKVQHEQSAQLVNQHLARHTEIAHVAGQFDRKINTHSVANTLAASTPGADTAAANKSQTKERMGKGDVDQIFSRLIMEEKKQQKPGLSSATIYKAVGVIVAIIIVVSFF